MKNRFGYSLAGTAGLDDDRAEPQTLDMGRQLILFGSLLFVGLTAGAAFVVWFVYNPDGMTSAFYVENMHQSIRRLTIPLPTIVVLGLLFTAIASFQARNDRPVFSLLATACLCVLAVGLITRFGNIPINNQILTWKVESPPPDWLTIGKEWWRLQTARVILQIAALCLVISAVLMRTK
ncbi:MAG TPA: DUF1772 domain-containing protein [Candidatus Sulfotelmatobacter sp.]|nr:DUF1772 domain-containing protein [Candidatus Sulfotelmatobacter sp.]